jgi:hypothetical protein
MSRLIEATAKLLPTIRGVTDEMELATRAHDTTRLATSRRPVITIGQALWKASSAATSLLLVVGAIVYGVALGSTGPSVSPVTVEPVGAVVSESPSRESVRAAATELDRDGHHRYDRR